MVPSRVILLLLSCVSSSSIACPEPCKCMDKFVHQIANCAYKQLESVPAGLPANITSLSLSANRLRSLHRDAFDEIPLVSSLWLSHNELVSVEKGTLAGLLQLRNLDLSNNLLTDFSWEDLRNLTALLVLKLNNNNLVHLPRDAFETLTDLRSLRLQHNRFATIEEGTFENLHTLSHLLLHENPMRCSCKARWLPAWLNTTTIDIPSKEKILCEEPEELKGQNVRQMPEIECVAPRVNISGGPDARGETRFYPDSAVVLGCQTDGLPAPTVSWKLRKDGAEIELETLDEEKAGGSAAVVETNDVLDKRVVAFRNGTLLIPQLSESEEGAYTCVATNDAGESSASVQVALTLRRGYKRSKAKGSALSYSLKKSKQASSLASMAGKKDAGEDLSAGFVERNDVSVQYYDNGDDDDDDEFSNHSGIFPTLVSTACALSHAEGSTPDDALTAAPVRALGYEQRHRFEFGVIALEVSDTDARVQLSPVPRGGGDTKHAVPVRQDDREWSSVRAQQQQQQQQANESLGAAGKLRMIYLCKSEAPASSPVQWSPLHNDIHFYRFNGLKPGTQYTLCLSHVGQTCEVQVPFETRKRIPSLLIMVVVSSFLLGLATIPLVGAACCHLVYQYRAKTYKPMHKPQQQQEEEEEGKAGKAVAGGPLLAVRVAPGEQKGALCAQRNSMCDSMGEVGDEASLQPSEEEASIPPAGCKDDPVQFDLESECSDRLPLGAEAVNIAQEINGNYKQPAAR